MGLSVVSQILCMSDIFPAFALPIIWTQNWIFGIRCYQYANQCVFIGATEFRKAKKNVGLLSQLSVPSSSRFLNHDGILPGSGSADYAV
ncbi:hypothetical protein EDB85DRAFT_2015027 [Lactarius pseudohatsudake]|nr:hypothetical protein EDB85DRAFT_2015027 [Lactarius pseudohatsudake]